MAQFQINLKRVEGHPSLALAEIDGARLGRADAPQLQKSLEKIHARGFLQLALDVSKVRFVDGAAMDALVKGAGAFRDAGGGVALIRVQPKVKVTIEMLGGTKFFPICRDLRAAAQMLSDVSAVEASGLIAPAIAPAPAAQPMGAPAPAFASHPVAAPAGPQHHRSAGDSSSDLQVAFEPGSDQFSPGQVWSDEAPPSAPPSQPSFQPPPAEDEYDPSADSQVEVVEEAGAESPYDEPEPEPEPEPQPEPARVTSSARRRRGSDPALLEAVRAANARLIVATERFREVIALDQPFVTVGREGENDINIASPALTDRHAKLFWSGGGFAVQDLGSKTGVTVYGNPIGETPTKLPPPCSVSFGPVDCLFVSDGGDEPNVGAVTGYLVNKGWLPRDRAEQALRQLAADGKAKAGGASALAERLVSTGAVTPAQWVEAFRYSDGAAPAGGERSRISVVVDAALMLVIAGLVGLALVLFLRPDLIGLEAAGR